jgi:hypothetical protein
MAIGMPLIEMLPLAGCVCSVGRNISRVEMSAARPPSWFTGRRRVLGDGGSYLPRAALMKKPRRVGGCLLRRRWVAPLLHHRCVSPGNIRLD